MRHRASSPAPRSNGIHRARATFRPLTTARTGNDIYTSQFAGFGTYALVQVAQASKGGGFPVVIIVLIALVVILVALILLVRIRRTRSTP